MKRIFTYILVMSIAMIAAVSCSNEALEKDTTVKGDFAAFTLRLCNIDPAQTKALTGNQIPGDDAYNENTIDHIDYFFFGDEAGTTLLYKGRLSVSDLTAVSGQNYTYEKEFNVTSTYPNLKYGCYVYVVANYPSTITATTLQALMALPLSADWTATQSSFVMDTFDSAAGSALHTLTPLTTADVRTFTMPLTRIAAKIQVNLKVAKVFTDSDNKEWTPVVDQLSHQFMHTRKTATLAGTPAEYESDADYVNTASVHNLSDPVEVTEGGKTYYSSTLAPYYSYPQTFDTGTNTSPYLKFQMPWVNEDKGYNNFYYKFLIPELTTFERNRIYIFNATIDVVGGTEEDFAEVIDNIYVADWWAPGTISATYESAKYLSVYNHSYTIYGEPGITVPVVSSDEIRIIGTPTGTKTNLKTGATVTITPTVTPNGKDSFTLTHVLEDNITDPDFDCTPITYTVTIQHVAGGLTKQETVTILQYPNIYVEKMKSNGSVFVNSVGYSGGQAYVSVTDNANNNIGAVVRPNDVDGNDDNTNQNNYNIYVSVLPSDSDYVIGDPRVGATSVNNLGSDVFSSYKAAGEDTQNVIAPAFKIASSYGKTTTVDYEYAKERCAAYQENGYPAGRWRLPTTAEIDFVISLSDNGHIPTLFGAGRENGYSATNNRYWYASYWAGGFYVYAGKEFKTDTGYDPAVDMEDSGNYTYTSYNNTGGYYRPKTIGERTYYMFLYTRCVYDIWYWGDAPMNNSGATATAQTDANGNVTGYTNAATQWLGYKMD